MLAIGNRFTHNDIKKNMWKQVIINMNKCEIYKKDIG